MEALTDWLTVERAVGLALAAAAFILLNKRLDGEHIEELWRQAGDCPAAKARVQKFLESDRPTNGAATFVMIAVRRMRLKWVEGQALGMRDSNVR